MSPETSPLTTPIFDNHAVLVPFPIAVPLFAASDGLNPADVILGSIAGVAVTVALVVASVAIWQKSVVRRRLRWFLGREYRQLATVSRGFSILDVPNVRRAIDAFVTEHHATLETINVTAGAGLQSLKLGKSPPQFRQMDIDVDTREDCLTNPLYLVKAGDQRWAIMISGISAHGYSQPSMEVMSTNRDEASDCIQSLRKLMRVHSIYRGKVISIENPNQMIDDYDQSASANVKFHRLPPVAGDAIILPPETMRRVHRNTVGFFQNVVRLKQQGFSAKRGLLFHGPPGTGKTRTACWLTHSLPGVTVFLVTGEQLWNIKECCRLARELAPAMLILEDVDLIATRRDQNYQTTALHQLMNEMDRLDSDSEILFLLTTNQPDQIEPALANRPGRIDQAIHFPLPDDACRQRLIELYRGRSTLAIKDWSTVLGKTSGSSPAFIKELVRKAAMIAVEGSPAVSDSLTLTDHNFSEAIGEMTSGDGKLTRRITGFSATNDAS